MRTLPRFKFTLDLDDEVPIPSHVRDPTSITLNTRHRFGGSPDFIHDQEIPHCRFGRPMTFYAQLDSISEAFMLAERGMIYVFVCFDCFETKALLQSY